MSDETTNQGSYYYANGQRIPLVQEPGVYAVRFKTGERADSPGLSLMARRILRDQSESVNFIPNYGLQVYRTNTAVDTPIQVLNREESVEFATPAYRRRIEGQTSDVLYVTNQILVQFKPDVDRQTIDALNQKYQTRIVEPLKYAPNGYLLELESGPNANRAVEIANAYYESGRVIFAMPNLIKKRYIRSTAAVEPMMATAVATARRDVSEGGEYLEQQWHLRTAKVVDAWELPGLMCPQGDPNITIAILDDGVDVAHPEFNKTLSNGSAKVAIQHDFAANSDDGSPKGADDNHGTSCAGVVTAGGVKAYGAAPNCRLMVGITPLYLGAVEEGQMFQWAADNGADIISCSWGGRDGIGLVEPLADSTRTAIHYCVTQGRGGKGIPIFWAAGNGNESLDLPGKPWQARDGYAANYPDVMAIAASTSNETRAYYSDFGPEVCVCAPSSGNLAAGEKGIFTTDRAGADGYNPGTTAKGDAEGNYTNSFGGTSSAAPLVAGIAALMLSANPDLKPSDVRDILGKTADKIGSASEYDSNGHSENYGYGRVNAKAAVQMASSYRGSPAPASGKPTIQGPGSISRSSNDPPEFQVDPSPNPYYIVEVATQAQLFDTTNHEGERTDANFYGSWQDEQRFSSATYTLPSAVWQRLKSADRLFYRVGSMANQQTWDNYLTDTSDDDYANAKSITITGAAGPADRSFRDVPEGAPTSGEGGAASGADGGATYSAGDSTIGDMGASDAGSAGDGGEGDVAVAPTGDDTEGTASYGSGYGGASDSGETVPAASTSSVPGEDTVRGIDVSVYQKTIDWQAVAQEGVAFAFARATYGLNVDKNFAANWADMKAAGLARGAYHYFKPAKDADQQADNFIQTVGSLEEGDLPPVIDVEETGGKTAQEVLDGVGVWIDRVWNAPGRKPMIYTGPSF